jgi:DNA repair exonuclease SbcCD ATPase subunit
MALRVAMSNVSSLSKSDMFIVDEGFGALDPQNIEAVTGLLHRLKSYYRLILIISHVEFIKDSVDEVIEITRNGVDSKVVYE